MITILFVALAAIFKAAADTMADHYSTSIWKNADPNFYDKVTSSVKAKQVFRYKIDGWHLSNSAMIICFIVACFGNLHFAWWLQLIVLGTVFNLTFNIFYNKIFVRK